MHYAYPHDFFFSFYQMKVARTTPVDFFRPGLTKKLKYGKIDSIKLGNWVLNLFGYM